VPRSMPTEAPETLDSFLEAMLDAVSAFEMRCAVWGRCRRRKSAPVASRLPPTFPAPRSPCTRRVATRTPLQAPQPRYLPTPRGARCRSRQRRAQSRTMEATPPTSAADNISVVARVRPLLRGAPGGAKVCVSVPSPTSVQVGNQAFGVDAATGSEASQEEVFEAAGRAIADACLAGFNGTIFAYGQTGSGKTYTILGACARAARGARGAAPARPA
jgi:hypothetical protein